MHPVGGNSEHHDGRLGSIGERQQSGSAPGIAATRDAIIAVSASGEAGHLQGG